MNEEQIRKIVKDEMVRNYQGGNPQVPPHKHDGNDNLKVPFGNITDAGVPINYVDVNSFTGTGSYTSPTLLSYTSTNILNNYADPITGKINLNPTEPNLKFTFPIPMFSGTGFEGGFAPIGTMVGVYDGVTFKLYVAFNSDGLWKSVTLT